MVGLVGHDGFARDVRDTLMQSGATDARGTCGTQRKRGVCACVVCVAHVYVWVVAKVDRLGC